MCDFTASCPVLHHGIKALDRVVIAFCCTDRVAVRLRVDGLETKTVELD